MSILRQFFKKNFSNKLVWLVVISGILLSLFATRIELAGDDLINHPFYKALLSPFDDVRYGYYVARKLFLVVVAFLIFGYWLKKQRGVLQYLRNNFKYFIIIGLVLFLSRILTYGFWFYNDDTRFFHWHLFLPTQPYFNPQSMWGPIGLHPIAIFLLVIRWFGTNYALYNTLGLIFYFLAGVGAFALVDKLQNNKFISLAAALFLLTTPTYFQGRLLIGEVVNSPFILLLVILAIYLLLRKFLPGALIFAAAALEYGVAKSYFIVPTLTLFALFFVKPKSKSLFLFIAAIFLISFFYLPAFGVAPSSSGKTLMLDRIPDQLLVLGDVFLAQNLSYGFSYPLVHLLSLILNNWIYITITLGFLIIATILMIAVFSYIRGKTLTTKLTVIALSIILPTAAVSSFMGVRIDHNIQKLVLYSNNGNVPTGATGYGIFPALGLTLFLVGLVYLGKKKFLKQKLFITLTILLILQNIVASMAADYRWLISPYGYPQRQYDKQLQKILPRDGIAKYIYVPVSQRPFYQGVITFGSIYQGDQGIFVFMSPVDFSDTIKKEKAQKDHIYFLITAGKPKYEIYDYSDKIRNVSYDRFVSNLESLTNELVPKDAEF